MVFWQLTIDANDPARLARFWAQRWPGSRGSAPQSSTVVWTTILSISSTSPCCRIRKATSSASA